MSYVPISTPNMQKQLLEIANRNMADMIRVYAVDSVRRFPKNNYSKFSWLQEGDKNQIIYTMKKSQLLEMEYN